MFSRLSCNFKIAIPVRIRVVQTIFKLMKNFFYLLKLKRKIFKRLNINKSFRFKVVIDEEIPHYVVKYEAERSLFRFRKTPLREDFLLRFSCVIDQLQKSKKDLIILLSDGYDSRNNEYACSNISVGGHRLIENAIKDSSLATFSDNLDNSIKLVDPYFFRKKAYNKISINNEWLDRENILLWRGATTGNYTDVMDSERVNLCNLMLNNAYADVKIYNVVQTSDDEHFERLLNERELMGEKVAKERWQNVRFTLSIDGNTNTWSSIIEKSRLGVCVFFVESSREFKQWFYNDLRDGQNCIMIKSDLSDLVEKLDFYSKNQHLAQQIAENAFNEFSKYTLRNQYEKVLNSINTI